MEGYLGQVILFPKHLIPVNWEICDGRKIDVSKHEALYVVLEKDVKKGVESFSLPILDSPHSDFVYIICVEGTFPQRH